MSSLFRSSGTTIEGLGKVLWPQMRSIATSNAILAEKKKDPKAKTGQVRINAYTAFQQEGDRLKHALEGSTFAEAVKEIASEWRSLSDSGKKRFHDIADKHNGPKAEKPKKKPQSAYNRFVAAHYAEEKSKTLGAEAKDVFRAVAARWSALSEDKKASYKA